MRRLAAGMPSGKWISTSVGVVNTNNEAAMLRAALRLKKMREAKRA